MYFLSNHCTLHQALELVAATQVSEKWRAVEAKENGVRGEVNKLGDEVSTLQSILDDLRRQK